MQRTVIQGVEITLSSPDSFHTTWVDYGDYLRQLEAAWLRLSPDEPPLNPRLLGAPGLGKTTLACAVGQRLEQDVYIFQCTTDTRPEDLLITPVITGQRQVEYRASGVVTAMVCGGLLVLDEGNRMPERSWASLAPLMDERRYIESSIAGVKIHAHADFRLCVTMNDDSSVYALPGYIQSRLKPRIEILSPPWEVQEEILRLRCPAVDEDLLRQVFRLLKKRAKDSSPESMRTVLGLAQYAQKLRSKGFSDAVPRAASQVLVTSEDTVQDDDK